MYDFKIYVSGLFSMSVCSNLPRKKVVKRANIESPTGVTPWQIDKEKFKGGEDNPCACNDYPKTHKHYLMVC